MPVEFRPDVLTLYPVDPVSLPHHTQTTPTPGLSDRITVCFICINKLCKDKKVTNMLGKEGWETEWLQGFTKCLFIDCLYFELYKYCLSKQGLG